MDAGHLRRNDTSPPEAPNFAILLGPFLRAVSRESTPRFLALLERAAAERYRWWAAEWPARAVALNDCADREDEIADRIERLFEVSSEAAAQLTSSLPAALKVYADVFTALPIREQLRIQADAERQGAAAWRGISSQSEDETVRKELERCALLEEETADQVESLLCP